MRVFNLTDIETDVLRQRGLVGQSIAVSNRMVNPGEYADVEDSPEVRAKLEYLLQIGAVSIGQPPPPYVRARGSQQELATRLSHFPVGHIDVKETRVAGTAYYEAPPDLVAPPIQLEREDMTQATSDEPPVTEQHGKGKHKDKGKRR